MYMHDSLIGQDKIIRKGVIKEVLLPNKKLLSSDITILLGTEQIEFRDGESIFVIDKEIGIKEELQTTIFIAGNYLVCEILKGNIYIKEKEEVYCITDTGTKRKSKVYEKDIKWLNTDNFIDLVIPLLSARYNIANNNNNLVKQYLDNMSIDVVMRNVVTHEEIGGRQEELYMFTLKIIQEYQNFGLDKFDFKVYEQQEIDSNKYDGIDTYKQWKKERAREKKEKAAIRKAEQNYLSLKEGEDIVDFDEEDYVLNKFKGKNNGIIGNFEEIEDDEDDLEEYLDEE